MSLKPWLFQFFLKSWRLGRVRSAMRGYRKLKDKGRGQVIFNLKRELTTASLQINKSEMSSLVYGAASSLAESVLRQYLIFRLCGGEFNLALMRSVQTGRLVYPLPRAWQAIVKRHGFSVAGRRCSILWWTYCGMMLAHGALQWFRILLERSSVSSMSAESGYLADLVPGNFAEGESDQPLNIVQWYAQWQGRDSRVKVICHSVPNIGPQIWARLPVQFCSSPFPRLRSWGQRLSMWTWGVKTLALIVRHCFMGMPNAAFMFGQAVLAAKVRTLDPDQVAAQFLFHNSNWIYRPLWTYEAEEKGASVDFYFYSTNSEVFKLGDYDAPLMFGWAGMTWSRYLVWDRYQVDFLYKALSRENVEYLVVGPIPFEGRRGFFPSISSEGKFVSVFDVTPARTSVYQMLAIPFDYYVASVSENFLKDVCEACRSVGHKVVWKKKRGIGSNIHKSYEKIANYLTASSDVSLIDSDVSPFSVIEKSFAVISMPFTSTAHIAKEMGIPAVYYDSTGSLYADDPASHGVEIVGSLGELKKWLNSISR